MQQNGNENVAEGEQAFTSDAMQFHTLEIVQYTMPRIPKTKEWPARYKTPFVTIMEPWKAVANKVMKRSSV